MKITRAYLTMMRAQALKTGDTAEVARLNKIARFNGIRFD